MVWGANRKELAGIRDGRLLNSEQGISSHSYTKIFWSRWSQSFIPVKPMITGTLVIYPTPLMLAVFWMQAIHKIRQQKRPKRRFIMDQIRPPSAKAWFGDGRGWDGQVQWVGSLKLNLPNDWHFKSTALNIPKVKLIPLVVPQWRGDDSGNGAQNNASSARSGHRMF